MIGAEFNPAQSTAGLPLHEDLYTKLVAAGIYSSHGRDHMISTVCLQRLYVSDDPVKAVLHQLHTAEHSEGW